MLARKMEKPIKNDDSTANLDASKRMKTVFRKFANKSSSLIFYTIFTIIATLPSKDVISKDIVSDSVTRQKIAQHTDFTCDVGAKNESALKLLYKTTENNHDFGELARLARELVGSDYFHYISPRGKIEAYISPRMCIAKLNMPAANTDAQIVEIRNAMEECGAGIINMAPNSCTIKTRFFEDLMVETNKGQSSSTDIAFSYGDYHKAWLCLRSRFLAYYVSSKVEGLGEYQERAVLFTVDGTMIMVPYLYTHDKNDLAPYKKGAFHKVPSVSKQQLYDFMPKYLESMDNLEKIEDMAGRVQSTPKNSTKVPETTIDKYQKNDGDAESPKNPWVYAGIIAAVVVFLVFVARTIAGKLSDRDYSSTTIKKTIPENSSAQKKINGQPEQEHGAKKTMKKSTNESGGVTVMPKKENNQTEKVKIKSLGSEDEPLIDDAKWEAYAKVYNPELVAIVRRLVEEERYNYLKIKCSKSIEEALEIDEKYTKKSNEIFSKLEASVPNTVDLPKVVPWNEIKNPRYLYGGSALFYHSLYSARLTPEQKKKRAEEVEKMAIENLRSRVTEKDRKDLRIMDAYYKHRYGGTP